MSCSIPVAQSPRRKYPMKTIIELEPRIRQVLRNHGRLNEDADRLDAHADLYQSGMTSHASVNVMLALEGALDVEFPDHMLKRSVFANIASIQRALAELTGA